LSRMRFLSYLFRLSTSYSVLRDGPLRNNRIQTFNIKLKINQSKEIMPYENHFICTWYRTRCTRSTHQLLLQTLQPSYSQPDLQTSGRFSCARMPGKKPLAPD